MLNVASDRNVTILRPVGLQPSRWLEEMVKEMETHEEDNEKPEDKFTSFDAEEFSESIIKDQIEQSIEVLRELIQEISDELKMRIHIHEYDLPQGTQIPSRKASRQIMESNMITSINPNDDQLAYICSCMHNNPLMSALLAHSDEDFLEQNSLFEILDTNAIQLIPRKKLQRIFAGRLLPKDERKMSPLIRKALLYPL